MQSVTEENNISILLW